MYSLEIGSYLEGNPSIYPEAPLLNIDNSGLTLFLFFNDVTDSDVQDCKSPSPAKFRLYKENGILFFLAKLGNSNWLDTPYNINLEKKELSLIDLKENQGYSLTIILIEARTGEVKNIRLIGLGHSFSKTLKLEIEKQKNNCTSSPELYDILLKKTTNKHSTNFMASNAFAYCNI